MPTNDGPPPTEPTAIWQAVLAVVKARPAMGWVADFRLERFEAGVARIAPLPRKENRATFASTPRVRASLEAVLSEVLRAPVRVEVITPERRSGNAGTSDRSVGDGSAPPQGSSTSRLQRAMDLPTVRQLLEVFDISVVEVRDETPASSAASDDDTAAPGDAPNVDAIADEEGDEPGDR